MVGSESDEQRGDKREGTCNHKWKQWMEEYKVISCSIIRVEDKDENTEGPAAGEGDTSYMTRGTAQRFLLLPGSRKPFEGVMCSHRLRKPLWRRYLYISPLVWPQVYETLWRKYVYIISPLVWPEVEETPLEEVLEYKPFGVATDYR